MELKEFVKTTLVQIEEGVNEANKDDEFTFSGKNVEFDVAVVASSGNEVGGRLEVAYVIKAGGGL